jgi:thioredoxin 1
MNVIEVNSSSFKGEVLESPVPVLVDLYSPDCGPCRAMATILEELADEVGGQAKVVKVNAVEDIYLAAALRIGGYPTLVVFKGGQEVARFAGLRSKEKLKEALGVAA